MFQTCVFVDAGYLFKQGGRLLTGLALKRPDTTLDDIATFELLKAEVARLATGSRLLRIYWYDGALRDRRLSAEQTKVSRADNVKLRLGMVNSRGEQKEVDSLIVTDLIELARNHSISDAVIIAGDGDLRVGVQIAQTYGVRVHLIGVKPALGSQSPELVAEADTHSEWDEIVVQRCLKCLIPPVDVVQQATPNREQLTFEAHVAEVVREQIQSVEDGPAVLAHLQNNSGSIREDLDRPAIASLRDRVNSNLTADQIRQYRREMRIAIQDSFGSKR